jgi:hypothetical protein
VEVAGVEFLVHLERELRVAAQSIPLSATQVSATPADNNGMIQRLRARFHRLHAAAGVAGACGCGAGAHFMAHPCIEHAVVAAIALAIGFVAIFRRRSKAAECPKLGLERGN